MKRPRVRTTLVTALAAICCAVIAGGCAAGNDPGAPHHGLPPRVDEWSYQGEPGVQIQTAHYAIYSTISEEDLLENLPRLMEGALEQYRTLAPVALRLGEPMECYFFANRRQWADYTERATGSEATIYLQISRGGYALGDTFIAFYLGDSGTYSVAAHEGWHQFVARHFKGRLPPFLEEGIACMFENLRWRGGRPIWNLESNAGRTQALAAALRQNRLIPLARLVTMHAGLVVHESPEQIEAFYAQNWAFARFLWEGDAGKYRPFLQKLLSDTAAGTVHDPVGMMRGGAWNGGAVRPILERYFGDLGALDARYQAFIEQVCRGERRRSEIQ